MQEQLHENVIQNSIPSLPTDLKQNYRRGYLLTTLFRSKPQHFNYGKMNSLKYIKTKATQDWSPYSQKKAEQVRHTQTNPNSPQANQKNTSIIWNKKHCLLKRGSELEECSNCSLGLQKISTAEWRLPKHKLVLSLTHQSHLHFNILIDNMLN